MQRVDTPWFHGDVAVVSFQTCARSDNVSFRGFALYDVSNPRRPKPLARYSASNTRGSHEIWLGAHGGKAYVYTAILRSEWTSSPTYDPATNTATVPGRADFRIVEVTNPRHPVDVAEWGRGVNWVWCRSETRRTRTRVSRASPTRYAWMSG